MWHLLCSFSLFYAQQRDLVDAATHRTHKLPLVPPPHCLLPTLMAKSSLPELFPSSIEFYHILSWTQPWSTGAVVPWGHVGGKEQLLWDLLSPASSKPSPLVMRHHHCDPSSVGHNKQRFTAHLLKIKSNNMSENSHPVTWQVTTKATCRTFVVNSSVSSKCSVGYHAKGICAWCSVWVDGRPKQKKKILPCLFGLQSYKYILKVQQQFRFGPSFIMLKVTKGFKENTGISDFCLEIEI